MATFAASPSEMKHPESLTNLVAFPGSGRIWPLRQCLDGLGQGIGIDMRLPCTEMLGSPTQDILEVRFGRHIVKPNSPAAARGHRSLFGPPTASPASSAKWRRSDLGVSETPIFAASRSAFRWVSFSSSCRFNQPDALAQDFAGVLIAAGGNQPLDELRLLICQNDITCRHDSCAP